MGASQLQDVDHVLDGAAKAFDPQTYSDDTTDVNGDTIDRMDYRMAQGFLFVIDIANENSGDDVTYKVQESSTGTGSWTDVSGASAQLTNSTTAGNIQVDAKPLKRYIRLNLDSADATLGGANHLVAAHFVCLGGKESVDI